MKYWVYSYIWGKHGYPLDNKGTGLHAGSATSLFEMSEAQPEKWAITCAIEISKAEYTAAVKRGRIG